MISTILIQPFKLQFDVCQIVFRLLKHFQLPGHRQWIAIRMPILRYNFPTIMSSDAGIKKEVIKKLCCFDECMLSYSHGTGQSLTSRHWSIVAIQDNRLSEDLTVPTQWQIAIDKHPPAQPLGIRLIPRD